MDTNKFFSFSRIAMVMKREIMENWKINLYRLIGIYAAFALVMVLTMSKQVTYSDSQMAFQHYCSNIMGAFAFIIGIFGIVYAANIMENMITKEKRIAFLMLPATMIEKFVARFLIVTVGLAVAVFIAASLAEITRYLLLPLFNVPETFHQSVLYNLLSMASVDGEQIYRGSGYAMNIPYQNWLGELCGWAFLVWSHSLYILGGNYWYKKPFFKTLGTLMLISILFSVLSVHMLSWIGDDNIRSFAEWLEANFQWMTLNKLLSLGVAFFSAFTMFNWWLSYRFFTRSQVVKPKFRLL
ncbi:MULTISPECIES: hypothetical protein [Phocaeicola]|jgi:hypothetical protein|uniref:Transmembrane protein n=1 Tax=Phocaeicola vulgatus TaxID=821 RepID=A0A415BPF5_PHOVU|nr:hypothetical protein [Phocaeicola vulgatus]RHI88703.1 hypothetical protein DW150_14705 [Phocaeicola vulgatus]